MDAEQLRDHYSQVANRLDPSRRGATGSAVVTEQQMLPPPPSPVAPEAPRRRSLLGRVTAKDILHTTAEVYGVKVLDLASARRTNGVVIPRHVAMYLCREHTPLSFPQIGRILGNRDHTTCMFGWRKIGALLSGSPSSDLVERIALIRKITGIETDGV